MMFVIVTENVPARLRGRLALWLVESRAGVYVGNYTVKTRDLIWHQVEKGIGKGNAVLMWQEANESGFDFKSLGPTSRQPVDLDGMKVVAYRTDEAASAEFLRTEGIEPPVLPRRRDEHP